MTITDYSHIAYYGGMPSHPATLPDDFVWLFDSFEVSIPNDSTHKIKHICVYNVNAPISVNVYMSINDVVKSFKALGYILDFAHPMWTSTYYTPTQMQETDYGLRFCEVYNGLTQSSGAVSYPEGKDIDFAWEALLDKGIITWGIAVTDQHVASGFKDGCVKVFADDLSREAIIKSLCLGNFYASTDADSAINSITFVDGTITIDIGDSGASTVFMKEERGNCGNRKWSNS